MFARDKRESLTEKQKADGFLAKHDENERRWLLLIE
jgi:hypothetical protein